MLAVGGPASFPFYRAEQVFLAHQTLDPLAVDPIVVRAASQLVCPAPRTILRKAPSFLLQIGYQLTLLNALALIVIRAGSQSRHFASCLHAAPRRFHQRPRYPARVNRLSSILFFEARSASSACQPCAPIPQSALPFPALPAAARTPGLPCRQILASSVIRRYL